MPESVRSKPVLHSRILSTAAARRQPDDQPSPEAIIAGLRSHTLCVLSALTAAAIFTLTEHDDHQMTAWCIFEITMQTGLVIVASLFFRKRAAVMNDSAALMPSLVMIACLSLMCEPFQRMLLGEGRAFEILIMHCLCHLMLALASCGFRLSFQRLAILNAVFLSIFCATISDAPGLIIPLLLFGILTIAWMTSVWWESVDRRLLRNHQARFPWFWATASLLIPLILTMAGGTGMNRAISGVRGLLPGSGGTGDYSPYSRSGIGDGDALVAGDRDIRSFAPIEDAPFLDSDKPSLYDVFNDLYNEPKKLPKKQERTIALPPEEMRHVHQRMAEARQAGREFTMRRNDLPAERRKMRDLNTPALCYVNGRTPLHLRMTLYDYYDGDTFYPVEFEELPGERRLRNSQERDWLMIPPAGGGFELFGSDDTHRISIANLEGNIVPTPHHIHAVSIEKVNKAHMYTVSKEHLVGLQRKQIPAMTPIAVLSYCTDRDAVAQEQYLSFRPRPDVTSLLPDGHQTEEIRALADAVTEGLPHGWQQVVAIENYLRTHYTLDPDHADAESEDPVHHFLTVSRRGPDYLFAGAAVCLLRSKGYSARLVSGLYASPSRYDHRKRQTPVLAEDAHFWCEVFVGAETWLTLEPSPGYELLQPPLSTGEIILAFLIGLTEFCRSHWLGIFLVSGAATGIFLTRKALVDAFLTYRWRLRMKTNPRARVLGLAALAEHRISHSGSPRPPGETMKSWSIRSLKETETLRSMVQIAEAADHWQYGNPADEILTADEAATLCHQISSARLKAALPPTSPAADRRSLMPGGGFRRPQRDPTDSTTTSVS